MGCVSQLLWDRILGPSAALPAPADQPGMPIERPKSLSMDKILELVK